MKLKQLILVSPILVSFILSLSQIELVQAATLSPITAPISSTVPVTSPITKPIIVPISAPIATSSPKPVITPIPVVRKYTISGYLYKREWRSYKWGRWTYYY